MHGFDVKPRFKLFIYRKEGLLDKSDQLCTFELKVQDSGVKYRATNIIFSVPLSVTDDQENE